MGVGADRLLTLYQVHSPDALVVREAFGTPRPKADAIAVTVSASIGDYRAGDEVWCETLQPEEFGRALNRDILVPRPAGRFLFGRLIGREEPRDGEASGKLHLLPLGAGLRQQVVTNAPWIAMATKLVRSL